MLVHGFRNKNFAIWTIFGRAIAFLVKMTSKIMLNAVIEANKVFFAKNYYNSVKKFPNSKIFPSKYIY